MLKHWHGRFKRWAAVAALLCAPVAIADDLAVRAQALLDNTLKENDLPALTAGIAKDGEIVWVGAAGFMDFENKAPAVPDMVHRIASISKPMTAVAAMQLVEQGKLDLNAPLRRYVPSWPENPEGEILIWHLLSHTSGIKHYEGRENSTTIHYPTLLDATELFKNRPLAFAPGQGFVYTTYGYTALGAALESASGENYGEYMQAHIWAPAGMDHTSLDVFGADVSNKAKLYRRTSSGPAPDRYDDNSVKYPGGGIQSTAADLLRFAIAFEDGSLVSDTSRQRMFEIPQLPESLDGGLDYGLGWTARHSDTYGNFILHSGGQSGTSTFLLILRDKKIAVSVLCNLYRAGSEVQEISWGLAALADGREPRSTQTN